MKTIYRKFRFLKHKINMQQCNLQSTGQTHPLNGGRLVQRLRTQSFADRKIRNNEHFQQFLLTTITQHGYFKIHNTFQMPIKLMYFLIQAHSNDHCLYIIIKIDYLNIILTCTIHFQCARPLLSTAI